MQLSCIQPENKPGQFDLFEMGRHQTDGKQLMDVMDRINRRFPKAILFAATGLDKTWKAKSERISQRYTTDWWELVCVKCV